MVWFGYFVGDVDDDVNDVDDVEIIKNKVCFSYVCMCCYCVFAVGIC